MTRVALSIAGFDPSGGAGVLADVKTFEAHGLHGAGVVTLLTAQDTRAVAGIQLVDAAFVARQLQVLLADVAVAAAKTGALGSAEQVEAVAGALRACAVPLVVDPVLVSTSGAPLLDDAGLRALRALLLPRAALVTPNLAEARRLCGREVTTLPQMRDAARAIADLGARAVLVKGGHHAGAPIDVLCADGALHELDGERIAGELHGLGCALSAAITAHLAQGDELLAACVAAKSWLSSAMRAARAIGAGRWSPAHGVR